jgi:hypothetical protein
VAVILGKQFPQHLPESCHSPEFVLFQEATGRQLWQQSQMKAILSQEDIRINMILKRHGETERESMQIDTKLQAFP